MAMYPRIPYSTLDNIQHTYNETELSDAFYWPDPDTFEDFYNYFVLEYGEFTPIYSEPDMLLKHIRVLSASLQYTIDKLYNTLSLTYDPIENYDRHENTEDTRTPALSSTTAQSDLKLYQGGETMSYQGNETTSYAGSETTSYNGSETDTQGGSITQTNSDSSRERQVSADNTGAYFPSEKEIVPSNNQVTTYNGNTTTKSFGDRSDTHTLNGRTDTHQFNDRYDTRQYNDRSDTGSMQSTNNLTGTDTNVRASRIHGNIGVTTTQQMIKSERFDVAFFNLIDEVAYLYAYNLLILIY